MTPFRRDFAESILLPASIGIWTGLTIGHPAGVLFFATYGLNTWLILRLTIDAIDKGIGVKKS